jgi:hypothetical protein
VPYKAKPITQTSGGTINRDVLQPGTPRTSVTGMLFTSVVATGPHLTWARVQFSNSGVFLGWLDLTGNSDSSTTRNWQAQNLMIEFDEQDRVRRHHIVSDSKLLPEVDKLLNDGSLEEPNFTTPVKLVLPIEAFDESPARPTGRLTLSEGGISWVVDRMPKVKAVPAALTNVRHRRTCPRPTDTSDPELWIETLCASFDLLRTSGLPLRVTTRVSAQDLFVLVAYARKFQHASDSDGGVKNE